MDIQRHLFGFRDARNLFNRLADWFTNIAFSQIQCRVSGIEPRNLQQINEHLLKSANLPVQQFHRAPGRGIIPVLMHRQHVRRHAHGRHRRTQLMADVRDEFTLHIAGFFKFIDFLHQRVRHLIEGTLQHTDLILSVHLYTDIQIPRCHGFG